MGSLREDIEFLVTELRFFAVGAVRMNFLTILLGFLTDQANLKPGATEKVYTRQPTDSWA